VVEVTDVVAGVMDAGIIAVGVVAHLVAVGRFSSVVK
jgi:hypothetical protein